MGEEEWAEGVDSEGALEDGEVASVEAIIGRGNTGDVEEQVDGFDGITIAATEGGFELLDR